MLCKKKLESIGVVDKNFIYHVVSLLYFHIRKNRIPESRLYRMEYWHAPERELRPSYVIGQRKLVIMLSSYDYFPLCLLKQETLAFCFPIANKSANRPSDLENYEIINACCCKLLSLL